jgi:hypothetical protein
MRLINYFFIHFLILISFEGFAEVTTDLTWVVKNKIGDYFIVTGPELSDGSKLYYFGIEHTVEKSDGELIFVKKNLADLKVGDKLSLNPIVKEKNSEMSHTESYMPFANISTMKVKLEFIGFGTKIEKYDSIDFKDQNVNWRIDSEERTTQTVPLELSADFGFEKSGIKIFPDVANDGGSIGPYYKIGFAKAGVEFGYYENKENASIYRNNIKYAYADSRDSTLELAPFLTYEVDAMDDVFTDLLVQGGIRKIKKERTSWKETLNLSYFKFGGKIYRRLDTKFAIGVGAYYSGATGDYTWEDSTYGLRATVDMTTWELYPLLIRVVF